MWYKSYNNNFCQCSLHDGSNFKMTLIIIYKALSHHSGVRLREYKRDETVQVHFRILDCKNKTTSTNAVPISKCSQSTHGRAACAGNHRTKLMGGVCFCSRTKQQIKSLTSFILSRRRPIGTLPMAIPRTDAPQPPTPDEGGRRHHQILPMAAGCSHLPRSQLRRSQGHCIPLWHSENQILWSSAALYSPPSPLNLTWESPFGKSSSHSRALSVGCSLCTPHQLLVLCCSLRRHALEWWRKAMFGSPQTALQASWLLRIPPSSPPCRESLESGTTTPSRMKDSKTSATGFDVNSGYNIPMKITQNQEFLD